MTIKGSGAKRLLVFVLLVAMLGLNPTVVAAQGNRPTAPGGDGDAIERTGSDGVTVMLLGSPYLTEPSSLSPAEIVLEFVERNRRDFGLNPTEVDQLVVRAESFGTSGGHYVTVGREINGVRVVSPGLTAAVDADGRLVSIGGTTADGPAAGAATLNALQAISAAGSAAGVDIPVDLPPQASRGRQQRFDNTFALTQNPNPVTAELVWYPTANGRSLRPAWITDFEIDGDTWLNSVVDARTGEVVRSDNLYVHAEPEGTVFTGQHPDDSPARSVEPFSGIDGSWVDDRVTTGNNVLAYRDLDNSNAVGYQPETPASGDAEYQHFNYAWTDAWRTNADGSDASLNADIDAVITQLFYYTNVMHDWAYGYGFTEVNRNFQTDNFGRGGSEGDPVLAEAQDGWDFGCAGGTARCRNNAFFGTPADGSSPRMQMYMWSPTRPYRDGSMDGDVIAHEYGHGISTRLVGGGNTLNYSGHRVHSSLGEGWSDIISFLKWDDTTVGEYVTGNAATGIRRVAYDTSDHTYSDYNPNAGTGHPNGEVWATMVYDIREALGLEVTTQLVFDGMMATPGSPTFLDARDGIISADVTTNGGANFCGLWAIFASNGLGVNADFSFTSTASPVDNFEVPAACMPGADAGGPYSTPEGTDIVLDGSGSTDPTDPTGGSIASYDWDFDNDGEYDDATGVSPTFSNVGDDAVYTIGLQVTSTLGVTDEDATTVTVTNVDPEVTLDPVTSRPENTAISLGGVVSDPGWLDSLTATVDWDDGTGPQPLNGATENTRPDATLTFLTSHTYGDDGAYQIEVCANDDDGGSDCTTTTALVTNVDPTADIDQDVYFAHEGETLDVSGTSTDPGSDDLTATWSWDDGSADTVTVSLVNPPVSDPPKSPSIQPRNVAWDASHIYAEACLYELGLEVVDDDNGSASDEATVIITGNDDSVWGSGWWMNQYRPKPPNYFSTDRLECYLDIVRFMSNVFDEVNGPLNSRPHAVKVLFVAGNSGSAKEIFDEHLLAAWLNFANGGFDLDTMVDSDGDGIVDATFLEVMATAEAVRLSPTSTRAEILAQKAILEAIVVGW